jgi:hypothetical protein
LTFGSDSGETFPVLKEKEIRQFAEYRTRRLVLKHRSRLQVVPQKRILIFHWKEQSFFKKKKM